MKRINLLTPQRCITKYISKQVETTTEEGMLKHEQHYGTPFTKEKMDDEFLAKLEKVTPESIGAAIGIPPENKFIPKNLAERKAVTDEPLKAPKLILNTSTKVWFKQDDTFNLPLTFVQLKIETTDLLYPLTTISQAFTVLWKSCLFESLRELNYMANLAGIAYSITLALDHLECYINGYNDEESLASFISAVLKSL